MLKKILAFIFSIFVKTNDKQQTTNEQQQTTNSQQQTTNSQQQTTNEQQQTLNIKTMKILTGTDCLKKYGWGYDLLSTPDINEQLQFERKWMTIYLVPASYSVSALPKKIYCNKDLVTPLGNAFSNLNQAGLLKEIKTWDGCFNPRPIRGYEEKFKALIMAGKNDEAAQLLSIHTWAIAIDVNAAWNRLGATPTLTKEFVQCWLEAGFDWGGDWSRKDGMHFQLKSNKI